MYIQRQITIQGNDLTIFGKDLHIFDMISVFYDVLILFLYVFLDVNQKFSLEAMDQNRTEPWTDKRKKHERWSFSSSIGILVFVYQF